MKTTRNLGLVKAIFVGATPPENTDVLWRDTSLSLPLHKYFNQISGLWEPLINSVLIDNVTIKKDALDRLYVNSSALDLTYRSGQQLNISGNSFISFSSSMPNLNYYVQILSYISNTGIVIQSGFSANSQNQLTGFLFIPPSKYPQGSLVYLAMLYK